MDDTGALQSSFAYTYDADNYRKTVNDQNGSLTTYSYDGKHRLTQAQTSGTNAENALYSYDGNDNILTNNEIGSTQTFMYDAANRITTVLSSTGVIYTFSFDANGNNTLVQTPTALTTNTYDKENRLSKYQLGSYTFRYSYDGDGLKRVENINGVLTTLVWDGDDYLQGRS